MKYEMIFGDEALFDSLVVPDYVEVIRINDYSKEYLWGDLNTVKLLTYKELKAIPIVAMRRIIKEPKRWTVADQKAGRLPEVGYLAIWNDDAGRAYTVKTETAFFCNECAISIDNEAIYFAEKFCLSPIETPYDKAQREENEFVKSEMKDTTLSIEWACIYERGVRAAYRKLKGGE